MGNAALQLSDDMFSEQDVEKVTDSDLKLRRAIDGHVQNLVKRIRTKPEDWECAVNASRLSGWVALSSAVVALLEITSLGIIVMAQAGCLTLFSEMAPRAVRIFVSSLLTAGFDSLGYCPRRDLKRVPFDGSRPPVAPRHAYEP